MLSVFSGLAVSYSPASWDAVPLPLRHLTSEFGKGSGVLLALWPPNLGRQASAAIGPGYGLVSRLFRVVVRACCCTGLCRGFRRLGLILAVSVPDQAYRAISTGRLSALLHVHLRPIDVVVFHGPQGRPCFEVGFPLRCLQRLSCPFMATQHCRGRDNWSTSGTFTPVLSY